MPFIVGAGVPAALLAAFVGPGWSAPFVALALFFAFFFRDPERQPPADDAAVVAPADGRVMVAGDASPDVAPPGRWQQVSIFLSPLDVHVNRIPISGRITRVEYRPGRFLPAYRRDAAVANERNEIWIEHEGLTVICRQVVGVLARRIVCDVAEGADVKAGDRFGMMKFGSRIDLFLPVTASPRVRIGQKVRAGETILARMKIG